MNNDPVLLLELLSQAESHDFTVALVSSKEHLYFALHRP